MTEETSAHDGAAEESATPSPAPGPDDEPTAKHDLRKLGPRLAKQRRRTQRAELSVKRKGKREVHVTIDRTSTVIGRDPRCDIVLAEEPVSRRHARIVKTEWGYFELIDMGSRNGTLVEGARVPRMTLCDGDGFSVGDTRFVIHLREEEG